MTAKDKVLQILPNAYVSHETDGERIVNFISEDYGSCLSTHRLREDWAWAEAYRNLKQIKP